MKVNREMIVDDATTRENGKRLAQMKGQDQQQAVATALLSAIAAEGGAKASDDEPQHKTRDGMRDTAKRLAQLLGVTDREAVAMAIDYALRLG